MSWEPAKRAPDTYHIWLRDDNVLGASANHHPRDFVTGGAEPLKGSTERVGSGRPVTFKRLEEFSNWNDAVVFIFEYLKVHPNVTYAR